MPLVLVTEPLSPDCNTYVSLVGAMEYVTTRVADAGAVSAWQALSADVQAMYLVNASRTLDNLSQWIGRKYSESQGLKWPRYDAVIDGYTIDSATVPTPIVHATVEYALWLVGNSGAQVSSSPSEYDSIKVGPIAIDFNEGAGISARQYFPPVVSMLLRDYGGITDPDMPSARSARQVRLVRS